MTYVKLRREFTCSICFKTYTRSPALTNHLRNHSGERPYSCTECDQAFMSRDSLRSHQAVHLPVCAKLPCLYCNQKFSRMSGLKRHEKNSCAGTNASTRPSISAILNVEDNASSRSVSEKPEIDAQLDDLSNSSDNRSSNYPSISAAPVVPMSTSGSPAAAGAEHSSDSDTVRTIQTSDWNSIFLPGLSEKAYHKLWWAAAKLGNTQALRDLHKRAEIEVDMIRVLRYPLCETALSICCTNGHSEATAALLDMGASLDMPEDTCPDPLLLAVRSGNFPTIQALLFHDSFHSLPDDRIMKAVHAAARHSNSQTCQFLYRNVDIDLKTEGAKLLENITRTNIHASDKLALIIRQLIDARTIDLQGHTALHISARDANIFLMQKTLEVCKDSDFINAKTKAGDTALHLLLLQKSFEWRRTLEAHIELVEPCLKLLLANGADVNMVSGSGRTPLKVFEEYLDNNFFGCHDTRNKLDEMKSALVRRASEQS